MHIMEEAVGTLSMIKVKDEEVVVDMSSDANSPASSAFVSALQSPYISPRAALIATTEEEQLPSTSYTPPSDPYEFSSSDTPPPPPPRISFSFPSFMLPPNNHNNNNAKLRSCDVYIGFHGHSPPPGLLRFCRWLKAELELQGIACFLAAESHSHDVAERLMCSAAFGLLVLTAPALSNRATLEEINFFSRKKNLLTLFFALDGPPPSLLLGELALHAAPDGSNWRACVGAAASLLRARLGSKSSAVEADAEADEVPFPRRKEAFVGREEDMAEMEESLWEGRSRAAVVCLCGAAGMGKTELALEFAHRHRQRYKSVVWVGGEGRHLRQNMLEVSLRVGLDVTADPERERGRIRSFDEQESEALKRVKRHLFMLDMPYLLVVDNLDSCADPLDFLPNNTGPSHIIVTTRLHSQSLPSSFHLIHLLPFPLSHSLTLFPSPTDDDGSLPVFHRKLNGLPFGLCLVASLLSELSLSPSALLQAVDQQVLLEDDDDDDNPFLTKLLSFGFVAVGRLAARMAGVGAWLAPAPAPARLLCGGREPRRRRWRWWWCPRAEEEAAAQLVRMGLARRANPPLHHDSDWIQVHPMAREYARRHHTRWGAKAAVRSMGTGMGMSQHLWASAFLVFGYKAEPPAVQLRPHDMVAYIRRTAVPLAKTAFVTFSRCNSAVELLKVCTNALEEVEKSFVSQIEDYWHVSSSLKNTLLVCLPCKTTNKGTVDEYVWQDVTLLKACLLEMRAKLLMRGGHFDTAEELCRTCISIRTVMLGHNHPLTLASQDTLSNLVRIGTKILL